ncbi:hypothetical protein K491DRAFT_54251 [Lophiostoma macrostomum CBS 122681]|uniref:UBA domain-containing protein n=1 Tax=Lophiostoma macrostomum CBS 122681 TaxID=1314788 RepID=A0A6A6SWX6_9PLEO|nr:hypothetical protein K491DRAFT_54251 [Lophiostoma macrostomum CBS 122681]
MASALNKRQQARNERALQELIKTVPGNGTCADCGARNPGWASWSNMKRIGNIESNKAYNPRNAKAQMPIDIDEVDSAMERYIRQKYQERAFLDASRPGTRQNTGSTSSVEDRPPPLPPKPTKRFTFGIQKSSTFPRSVTPPVSPGLGSFGQETSPPRVNKPSRVFGSNVNTSGDGLDSKLATLRDMGFPDEKRNSTVLRGLNGNLDRAVEALIRLGEANPAKSGGATPTAPAKSGTNGISIQKSNTAPVTTNFGNPFEALDAVPPLPQQQTQTAPIHTQQNPYGVSSAQTTSPTNPYNPFLAQQPSFQQQNFAPQQQQQQSQAFTQQQNPFGPPQQALEHSFQNLQLSNQQPQQQLFPNRTGGHSQSSTPQYPQTNPFQQSFTPPPMPQIPQQYASMYQPQQNPYQPMTSPPGASNPFLKSTRSQMFTSQSANSNPFGNPQQPAQHTPNPFLTQSQAPPTQIRITNSPRIHSIRIRYWHCTTILN